MSNLRTALLPGEQIVEQMVCSRAKFLGLSVGGTLFFTTQRIIFETNALNQAISNKVDAIGYNEISEYSFADNLAAFVLLIPIPGISVDKCIHIKRGNELIRYQPQNVKRAMYILEKVIPNVKRSKYSFMEALGCLLNYQ